MFIFQASILARQHRIFFSEGANVTQPPTCNGDFDIHCFCKENLSLYLNQPIIAELQFEHEKRKAFASEGAHFCILFSLTVPSIVVFDQGHGVTSGQCPFKFGAASKNKHHSFSFQKRTSFHEGEIAANERASPVQIIVVFEGGRGVIRHLPKIDAAFQNKPHSFSFEEQTPVCKGDVNAPQWIVDTKPQVHKARQAESRHPSKRGSSSPYILLVPVN